MVESCRWLAGNPETQHSAPMPAGACLVTETGPTLWMFALSGIGNAGLGAFKPF
jgi:hypothetical protein